MTRKTFPLLLALASLLPVPGTARAEETAETAPLPEAPAATYRAAVHPGELASWLAFRDLGEEHREQALRELILVEALGREAEALGLDRLPPHRWELERADLALVWQAYLAHTLPAPEVAEADVRELASLLSPMPRRIRLRNLFKRFPPDADEAARAAVRAEMETLLGRLRAGEDFGALAEAESDSQTRFQKGLVGNVRPGQLHPEVERVAMALAPGQMSEILESAEGLTLLHCEKILPAVERSPEELREIARGRLENQAAKKARRDLQEGLLAAADLRFAWPEDSADPGAVAVHWLEGRLTVADLQTLFGAGTASVLPGRDLERQVEGFIVRRMARLVAHREGLEEDPDLTAERRWTRLQILAGKALARRVQARFEPPSEEEIRRRFEGDRESYVRPVHYRLSVILLPIDTEDLAASHAAAERLAHRLRAGELPFAEAARRHSVHPSAEAGGRLGSRPIQRVTRGLGIQVGRALGRLAPGETSAPVEERSRLWILHLEAIEDARPMTFAEARDRVEQSLGQAWVEALERQVTEELWRRLAAEDAGGRPLR